MNYLKVIENIFEQYEGPQFSLKLWDAKDRKYGSGKKLNLEIFIKDQATAQKLISQGSLGFGESFMDGSLEVTGNIEEYLKLRHHFKKVRFSPFLAIAKFLANSKTPKNRNDQISYHYDLGNDFFAMFLDRKTMSYSAGFFKQSTTLGAAQQNKIDLFCRWLNLPRGASVLDLGSGWGGFALQAAKKYHWKVTGYTLSKAQLDYCHKLLKENHLEQSIIIKYRDMLSTFPSKKFDGGVMIESIEHVGKNNLKPFFLKISSVLKNDAPFVLQFTGRYIPKRVDRWTLKYVFPGGYLPSKDEIIETAEKAGFKVEEFEDGTPDYIKTMTLWINNLECHQKDIEKMFDGRFYRLWYLWMHGAKVNFELQEMSLFRIKLRKI